MTDPARPGQVSENDNWLSWRSLAPGAQPSTVPWPPPSSLSPASFLPQPWQRGRSHQSWPGCTERPPGQRRWRRAICTGRPPGLSATPCPSNSSICTCLHNCMHRPQTLAPGPGHVALESSIGPESCPVCQAARWRTEVTV